MCQGVLCKSGVLFLCSSQGPRHGASAKPPCPTSSCRAVERSRRPRGRSTLPSLSTPPCSPGASLDPLFFPHPSPGRRAPPPPRRRSEPPSMNRRAPLAPPRRPPHLRRRNRRGRAAIDAAIQLFPSSGRGRRGRFRRRSAVSDLAVCSYLLRVSRRPPGPPFLLFPVLVSIHAVAVNIATVAVLLSTKNVARPWQRLSRAANRPSRAHSRPRSRPRPGCWPVGSVTRPACQPAQPGCGPAQTVKTVFFFLFLKFKTFDNYLDVDPKFTNKVSK